MRRVIHTLMGVMGCALCVMSLGVSPLLAAVDLSPTQKLTPPVGADDDAYGWSVALDGDTLMVGSTYDATVADDAGAVYVYTWNGTEWVFAQQLTASDAAADDEFGVAIALEGDTAMISAVYDNAKAGAVYVFERDAGVWSQTQKLVPNDSAADDLFGISIALDGDLALIGAPGDATPLPVKDGSFYIYERGAGTWTQMDRVIAPLNSTIALGASVTLDGTTAYVGAVLDGSSQFDRPGAVYIYEYAAGELTQIDKVTASDGATLDLFGASIRVLDDTLLVGAPGASAGSVYTYSFVTDEWVQGDKITAPDPATYTSFGASMALDGETILVGAPNEMPQPNGTLTGTEPGAAYLFTRNDDTWNQQYTLTAGNTDADYFGLSVALEGNTAIVGAFGDNKGNKRTGAVHAFALNTNTAPVNTVPADGAAMTLINQPLKFFKTEPDHAVSIADADSATEPLLVMLQSTNGTLTLSRVDNLTFIAGDGTDDSGMTFTGAKSDINKALDGLTFEPDLDFDGDATITLTTNDQGHVGLGVPLEDVDVFTVSVEDAVELVKNGGFEKARGGNPKLAANWTGKQLDSTDRRSCNTANKTIAYRVKCAFRFTGAQGRNPNLTQTITAALPIEDTLVLSAYVNQKNVLAGRIIRATVKYTDNSTDKLNLVLAAGTVAGYQRVEQMLPLTKAVKSVKILINYPKKSGNFYLDAVSLLHYPAVPLEMGAESLRGN